jgi:hypothetical protein
MPSLKQKYVLPLFEDVYVDLDHNRMVTIPESVVYHNIKFRNKWLPVALDSFRTYTPVGYELAKPRFYGSDWSSQLINLAEKAPSYSGELASQQYCVSFLETRHYNELYLIPRDKDTPLLLTCGRYSRFFNDKEFSLDEYHLSPIIAGEPAYFLVFFGGMLELVRRSKLVDEELKIKLFDFIRWLLSPKDPFADNLSMLSACYWCINNVDYLVELIKDHKVSDFDWDMVV